MYFYQTLLRHQPTNILYRLPPAPLDLCFFSNFDLKDNISFCPIERNALKEFYDSAKGGEWTRFSMWTDSYLSHCSWYGVYCDSSNSTIKLDLASNGLSGTISTSIGNLSKLETMNLGDNDIKVSICIGVIT